jgi:hypothetical protein
VEGTVSGKFLEHECRDRSFTSPFDSTVNMASIHYLVMKYRDWSLIWRLA